MDNNFNGVAPSAPVKQKTSKTLIAGMTLCAAFAIAGAVFSGYALIKPSLDKNKETVTTDTKPEEKPEEKPETTIEKSPISTAEAEAILEKYIGPNNIVNVMDAFTEIDLHGFDDYKFELMHKKYLYNNETGDKDDCKEAIEYYCRGFFDYDTISGYYADLYGDATTIEREDISYGPSSAWNGDENNIVPYYKLVYDATKDGFVAYEPNGIGGTSPQRIVRKVVSVKKVGEDVIGELAYVIIDRQYAAEGYHEDLIKAATDSLRLYNFTLSPYNGTYVLTAFEKAE